MAEKKIIINSKYIDGKILNRMRDEYKPNHGEFIDPVEIYKIYFKDYIEEYQVPFYEIYEYDRIVKEENIDLEYLSGIRIRDNLTKKEKKSLLTLQVELFSHMRNFRDMIMSNKYIFDLSIYQFMRFENIKDIEGYKLTKALVLYYIGYKMYEVIYSPFMIRKIFNIEKVPDYQQYICLLKSYEKCKEYDYISMLFTIRPEIKIFYEEALEEEKHNWKYHWCSEL